MILGFSTHTEPSGLYAREYDAYKLAKAGRVQWRHSLIATPCRVMREDSVTRDRSSSFLTYNTQPGRSVSITVGKRPLFVILPIHCKDLFCLL